MRTTIAILLFLPVWVVSRLRTTYSTGGDWMTCGFVFIFLIIGYWAALSIALGGTAIYVFV